MDPSPGRSMRISLVQNRDCANFVVSCLNHIPPLINAFILNSPSTLNCPITALTLTDQTDSVSKANPSQIQTQARSKLKVGMLILPFLQVFLHDPHAHGSRTPSRAVDPSSHSILWLRNTRYPTCLSSFPPWHPDFGSGLSPTFSQCAFQPWGNAKDSSPPRSMEIFLLA